MLPIHAVLDDLAATLRERTAAVLVAPPGAGKTTVVPLALMDEPWARGGRLLVLEPRRLAARAAAARMAATLGEPVGRTVGFRVRGQSAVSAATRVEVVTEGVFTRMILDNPGLEGVAGVLFDEFHERSLDADLGLAFALDAQRVLRDDLRLLVMSATLDGARVAGLLGDAPLIESAGRAFPVETRHLGRDPTLRLEAQVARAIRRALESEAGGILAFLPGQGEIARTEALLAEQLGDRSDVLLAPLYGALTPAQQDRAVAPPPQGVRKLVLATSIAETSLTLEGVRVVVDGGFSRVPRFEPASGLTRLETVRVTRAAADQRRGRAGRTEPGVCYRLWDEAETRGLVPFSRPEMLEADLSGVALALAQWGARDPADLAFLDPPPAAAFAEARALLERLEVLTPDGSLSPHGRRLARLPLPPRLAHVVVRGAERGAGPRAAAIAALLSERGLGGSAVDLGERLERLARDGGARAREARSLAERWVRMAGDPAPGARAAPLSDGELLAAAFPERLAQGQGGGVFRLASGRGAFVEPTDALAREAWLAVAELAGGGARDRILLAAPLDPAALERVVGANTTSETLTEIDATGRLRAREVVRYGALVLSERRVDKPDPKAAVSAWLAHLGRTGLSALPFGPGAEALRARVAFLGAHAPSGEAWPDLSDAALLAGLEAWLGPLLVGLTSLVDLGDADLEAALWSVIGPERRRELDRLAPERLATPAGTTAAIDYAAEGGPRAEVRVQELFGLARHPTVLDGRVPLTLALLSPARRPVQTTCDLPGFWAGSWKAVRSEMKGRYPRHPWPEDPLAAPPTTRAKPRGT